MAAVFLSGIVIAVDGQTPVWWIPIIQAFGVLAGLIVQYASFYGRRGRLREAGSAAAMSMRSIFRASLPTAVAQFVQMGYYSSGVLLLGLFASRDVVGEYGAANRLMQLAVLPMVAMTLTAAPMYTQGFHDSTPEKFRRIERMYRSGLLVIGLLGAVGLALLGPAFLDLMAGRPMPVAGQTMFLWGVCYLLVSLHSPYTIILPYLGGGPSYLWVNALALVVAVGAGLVLIPRWGHMGAAVAATLGVVSLLASGFRAYRRQVKLASWARVE